MTRKNDFDLSLENRVDISKNQVEIEHNHADIERNTETLRAINKKVKTIYRILTLVGVLVISVFILIFLNGMLVHYQTGMHEAENVIFEN